MDDATATHLGLESKIRLPNVDEILDIGYAAHAADDPLLRDTEAQAMAKQIVAQFMALEPRGDTETAYIACARGTVLSHGRALTRRKQTWEKALLRARQVREARLERIKESRFQNGGLNLAWRLLVPVILGLTGYLFARVISFFVPIEIASQTGHKIPSILMGLVFVFIGRSISFWWSDFQRGVIELEYNSQIYQADMAYELGKSMEHKQCRARLCEAWKQYTGEEYPSTASYELVMAGDIETRRRLERQRQVFDRSTIYLLRRIARLLRGRKWKKDEMPADPDPVVLDAENEVRTS